MAATEHLIIVLDNVEHQLVPLYRSIVTAISVSSTKCYNLRNIAVITYSEEGAIDRHTVPQKCITIQRTGKCRERV